VDRPFEPESAQDQVVDTPTGEPLLQRVTGEPVEAVGVHAEVDISAEGRRCGRVRGVQAHRAGHGGRVQVTGGHDRHPYVRQFPAQAFHRTERLVRAGADGGHLDLGGDDHERRPGGEDPAVVRPGVGPGGHGRARRRALHRGPGYVPYAHDEASVPTTPLTR